MQLQTGLYHQLITTVLEAKLNALPEDQYYWESVPLDKAEAASVLAKYLEGVIQFALKEFSQKHDGIEHQVRFCNDLIMQVQALSPIERDYDLPRIRGKLLIGILSKIGKIDQQLKRDLEQKLPKSGLITSTLFTGSQSDLSLDSEIERDILSADRIRWVVSFIRWSGIRIFEEALRKYCNRDGADFRVITTLTSSQ